mmetsp:Transcript_26871/g.40480  ORF Transcript_26871/g.40480 Transcript_26871/m.40480 type:complete len:258 (-) Transcript_26871:38-811(-)
MFFTVIRDLQVRETLVSDSCFYPGLASGSSPVGRSPVPNTMHPGLSLLSYSGSRGELVQEGEAGDQVVEAIESGGDEVLRVVAEELQGGDHRQAAVLELLELALLELIGIEVGLANGEVAEDAPVVDGADEEDHLQPAEGRDRVDGGDAVGDVGERNAGGDLAGEPVELRHDVADDAELGDAAVLELSRAVLLEGLRADGGGEAERVEEASGVNNTELALVRRGHLDGRARGRDGDAGEGVDGLKHGKGDDSGGLHG